MRMQEEDCNAGIIFDCLQSEYWQDEKFAIQLISDALPIQNVRVVVFSFNQEEDSVKDEKVEMEVCTNYRYAQRHDAAFASKRAHQKKEEEKNLVEPSIRETPRASAAARAP